MLRRLVIHARTGWCLYASLLVVALASICGVLVVVGTTSQAVADVPDVALTPVGTFASPVYVTSPPGDPSRLFVVERGGTVRVVKDGVVLPTPFLDVSGEISTQDERGLLSIAFAPDYAISGLVYAFGTLTNGTLTVWEFHAAPNSDVADAGHRTVLSIPHSAANHNGGQLQFGPDGYLYIGVGDGGSAGGANGQNTGVLLGKILRMDPLANPSTGAPYSIPPGQPFAPGVLPEIYAYGLRNPWRFSFDSLTGDLMIGDVGDDSWEEIDELPAGALPGANFGWYCWEGTHAHGPGGCTAPGALSPIYEYAHDATHCSISGGFVARDPTVPTLAGRYLFADYCGAGASALLIPLGAAPDMAKLGAEPQIAGFGEDSDSHLYITSLKGGVWRITGTGAVDKPPVAVFTLSSTTPAVGANVHLDASGSTDPDGPIYRYAWDTDGDGKVDATGVTADVRLPDSRRARDHAHGHGRRRGAFHAHPAGLRRRQDDPAGHLGRRDKAERVVLGAGPPETQGRAQARAARPLPDQQACDVDDQDVLGAHDQGAREALPARKRRPVGEDVPGAHGHGHRAAEDPARPARGHAGRRDPRPNARARARRRRPRFAARSRRLGPERWGARAAERGRDRGR